LVGFLSMHLIILGSGTGIPTANRASPSLLFYAADGPVLFDMGPGTLRQLSRVGVPHEKLKRIFITHFHPDHSADLIHFMFATRNPSVLKKREPFMITGPQGLKDFLAGLKKAYGSWLNLPSEIMGVDELDGVKPDARTYPSFTLFSQPLNHTPNSIAYRVELPAGKSLVYSGDTGFCPEIIALAKGADLLILESSLPEAEATEGHLTPAQACRIASSAGAKRLVLLHFYPEVLTVDIPGECRKNFQGELILGSDLLHLSV
jgi:ribonuclease BN (tRNA processing enzyme)